jgi:subtilisin family serine protease
MPIDFPGDLPGYVTVGASNPRDERKTKTSSDGETWWGSNFGATMQLLAPGVFIWTTDIVGAAGYDAADFTKTFNGTSSATPAVAGAAALMLSANPALSASSVREILGKTANKLKGQKTWTPELGWGRLDVAKAVATAQVAGTERRRARPQARQSQGPAETRRSQEAHSHRKSAEDEGTSGKRARDYTASVADATPPDGSSSADDEHSLLTRTLPSAPG